MNDRLYDVCTHDQPPDDGYSSHRGARVAASTLPRGGGASGRAETRQFIDGVIRFTAIISRGLWLVLVPPTSVHRSRSRQALANRHLRFPSSRQEAVLRSSLFTSPLLVSTTSWVSLPGPLLSCRNRRSGTFLTKLLQEGVIIA